MRILRSMVKELRLEEVSNRKAADEKDTPQPGVVGGNRELHRTTYEKGMLDLRLQLTKMRIDYLTQINTQTTFIAGCAVGMLSSQELMSLDDLDGTPISTFTWWWKKLFDYTYTCSVCASHRLIASALTPAESPCLDLLLNTGMPRNVAP